MAEDETGLERSLAIALGDRLRDLRHKAGLTQEQLAHQADMTRNHYQVLESGRTSHGVPPNPTLRSIYNISLVLNIPITDLLDGIFPTDVQVRS